MVVESTQSTQMYTAKGIVKKYVIPVVIISHTDMKEELEMMRTKLKVAREKRIERLKGCWKVGHFGFLIGK